MDFFYQSWLFYHQVVEGHGLFLLRINFLGLVLKEIMQGSDGSQRSRPSLLDLTGEADLSVGATSLWASEVSGTLMCAHSAKKGSYAED